MVYRALFGAEGPSHVDIRSFLHGFMLPCRNVFNTVKVSSQLVACLPIIDNLPFLQAIRAFQGGPNLLISLLYATAITSFASISDCLDLRIFASVPREERTVIVNEAEVSLSRILVDFLQGSGIPFQAGFDHAQELGLFHPSIDLTRINTPAFRPQMFHLAATGSNAVQLGEQLLVSPVASLCGVLLLTAFF